MKSSKYTQVTGANGNEFCEFQNRNTTTGNLPADSTATQIKLGQHTNANNEQLLNSEIHERDQTIYQLQQCSETNANKYPTDEEFELMCNCTTYPNKQKLKQPYTSEQNIASTNRNFCSLTKLDVCANSSQFSLDRKGNQQAMKHGHAYSTCDQGQKVMQRIERVPSLKRIQSPEIINIHRGPNTILYEGYGSENCPIKSYGYDKDFKCEDYSLKRGQSFKRTSERSNDSHSRSSKRRPAGDGIDAEIEEPELIFKLTEQMRDCQCACDHVIYAPGYTTCLPLIPVSVKLVNTSSCQIDKNLPIHTTFFVSKHGENTQSVYGNASLDLVIDNRIVMTVLKMKMSSNRSWIPDKIYMRDSSFCRIVDNYLRRTTEAAPGTHLGGFCPIHRGSYQFYEFTPDFKGIQFPVEMLGYVKLRIELKRLRVDDYGNGQREMVACNEIELEERFPPAPDVTRRLGASTPLGKPESGTPPYYRSASAASSSSNSASSRIDLSTRHWWIIATVLLLAAAAGVGVPIALKISSGASLDERLEFASRLLQEVPLIDGHNDLPWNIRKFLHNRLKDFKFGEDLRNVSPWSTSAWSHTDLPRLKQGHVAAQFWAAYVPCDSQHKDAVQLTLEQIDVIRRLTEMYQPTLTLCTSSQEIRTAYEKNQLCSLIGVEGGHSLAGSLAVLRTLYHVGVRYLTLTSTCNTPWADCSHVDMPGKKPEHGGLTTFGKSVVKEMNRLGMIVDLSHVSVKTMRDALDVSKAPVIFSHSSAHALCNSTRNVPDATLRKLALNKGVVMVNFYSHFLTCKDVATVADAVSHINHIREVAGVDNVGLGAGYDGINYVPQGLEDVSSYPTLFAELIGTGKWTIDDLKKLAGLNFLRVFQDVERVRDEFKKAKVPPYEDVLVPRPKVNNCSSQDQF